jgi:Ca2+-binding RTX toxin-like protein
MERARARARRCLRAALGVAAACTLLIPASALAGSASVDGSTLRFTGGAERNSVIVHWDDGHWVVEDSAYLSAGPGCEYESSRRAACEATINRIVLSSGDGDDTVTNWSFVAASIDSGAGNDTVYGGAAADALDGGPGTDSLYGSYGDDSLAGGTGADRLSGGSGRDTVTYATRAATVRVDPDDRADDGESGEGDEVRSDVEDAQLGSGDDIYAGSALANHVSGGAGNDGLQGGDGDDSLDGGDGIDSYSGGAGADTITARDGLAEDASCGANDDTAFADPTDRVIDCEQVDTAGATPPANPEPSPAPAGGAGPVDGSGLLQGLELVQPAAPLALSADGALDLPVQCLADTVGGCRGTITLELVNGDGASPARRGRRRIGRRHFRVEPGYETDVSVRISRRGRRMIARRRKPRVRARIETQTASGPVTTVKTVRVKASRRGGRRAPRYPRKRRGR